LALGLWLDRALGRGLRWPLGRLPDLGLGLNLALRLD
jgi:hypothetical protein